MKIAHESDAWLLVGDVTSTQDIVADELQKQSTKSIVLARSQSAGKGRFDRRWVTPEGALAMSIAFPEYKNHSRPWLIGMACACAAASVIHCRLQWPNDLIWEHKKLGGVLVQIIQKVPVVGIGINVSVKNFPIEIAHSATSLHLYQPDLKSPQMIAEAIVQRIRDFPEPDTWDSISPIWQLFDQTAGKRYTLADGTEAIGIGIGPAGELIATVGGETQSVLAADAILGSAT